MPVQGHPVDPFSVGNYVFADEGELLGRAQLVRGLEAALDAAQASGIRRFPDVVVTGADEQLEKWLRARWNNGRPESNWSFLIRDNLRHRWVRLHGAFIRELADRIASATWRWTITSAEPADGPW